MAKKSKRFDYFDAFEKQAKLTSKEADLLLEIVEGYTSVENMKAEALAAHEIENEGDGIGHDIFSSIATDFITPIEREDIISLTHYLDDILDYQEDVVMRLYMYDIKEMHPRALEFARIIKSSCEALEAAMTVFRDFKKRTVLREAIIKVNDHEEEADRLFMEIVRDLHTQYRNDPMYVMEWEEIFNRMERCVDACEHAADTMDSISLKNS